MQGAWEAKGKDEVGGYDRDIHGTIAQQRRSEVTDIYQETFSSKIRAAIVVDIWYVRDTMCTKRMIVPSGYNMYSEEEGAYCSELMGVVKAFIPPVWGPAVFWHLARVAHICDKECVQQYEVGDNVWMKRKARGESKAVPTMY
jgi:hypothetical protein